MSVVRQVVLLLALSSVESVRPHISDEKLHAPMLYKKLRQMVGELRGESHDEVCQSLGGFILPDSHECICERLWSKGCSRYVDLSSRARVLPLKSEPLSPVIDVDQFVSHCYCPESHAESRAMRKKVQVSALRFCQTLFEDINKNVQVDKEDEEPDPYEDMKLRMKHGRMSSVGQKMKNSRSDKVSREARSKLGGAKAQCQRALTRPWKSSTWLQSGQGSKSAGRLDRMGHRWQWHLERVCSDECEKLVHKMGRKSEIIADGMVDGEPVHLACADRVVREVEANLLGCCGRSCGWDGHSCAMWPFLEEDQQRLWQVECCGEYTVLKGSDRERMCDSVLTAREKRLADKKDTDGTDEDAKSVGQNEQGSSLIEIFQQKGELGCNDKTFMTKCPEDIKAMHSSKCKELGNWKAVSAANWGANYHQFEDGCDVVGSRGSPKDCRDKGGRVFTWKWAEEAAKRTSECCTLKEQSSLPAGKAANTVNSIQDLMMKLVMFVP